MKNNRNWLVFANKEKCHHAVALNNLGFINWKMGNIKMNIGDIVYLFMSDERRVRFKTKVVAKDCIREDSHYWQVPSGNDKTYKLQLVDEYKGNELNEISLRLHGFNGGSSIERPMCNNPELFQYINEVFEKNSSIIDISDSEDFIRLGKFLGSGGEGKEHKKLKEYIYNYPERIGIEGVIHREMEHILLSGDRLDVYFELKDHSKVAVEIKTVSSPDADVLRGLFQCVKYKSILDAEDLVHGKKTPNKAILIIGKELSKENYKVMKALGVSVCIFGLY